MIDPMDIDPDTGCPYSNYSSPSLDTSFHDGEMDVDEEPDVPTAAQAIANELNLWGDDTLERMNLASALEDLNKALAKEGR